MPSEMVDLPAHLAARTGDSSSPLQGIRVLHNTSVATRIIERRRTIGHGGCSVEGHKALHFQLQTAVVMLLFAVLTERCATARFTEKEAQYFRQWLNEKGYDADVNSLWYDGEEHYAIKQYQEAKDHQEKVTKLKVGTAAASGALAVLGGTLGALGSTRFAKTNDVLLQVGGYILFSAAMCISVIPLVTQIFYRGPYGPVGQHDIENLLLRRAKGAEAAREQAAANGA